ncbi:MAG TPA: type II toxin-antitoxin system VapC family toxin [Actinotalea sp.]|nr:type II toxin-antitoxin system VapC family toxin [Actinotalea sp.]
MRWAPCATTVIVVDASVLAVALLDDGQDGDLARDRLSGRGQLAAPALIALEDLAALPLQRAQHAPLLHRCWELRDNLTIYDAPYVALAEALDATLLTGDRCLARATGTRCTIEVLSGPR